MSELKSTNIRSAFALSFCLGIFEQIMTGPVFVLYLYETALGAQGPMRSVSTGPNSLVGFNQGVYGVVKLLSVVPIGWLVDRDSTRRTRPLRASLLFGLATVIIGGFLWYTDHFAWVTVLISCCAIFLVLCQSASRSILTDSIPEGKREGIFVKQFVCYLLGTASGPVLAAVVILASSGSSSASHVKLALVCGLVVVAPIASIIFTFVDPLTRESMERGPKEGFAARPEATQGNDSNVRINVSNLLNLSVKRCTGRWVPILCVTFSVVSIVGGGLIAPFFTLFFKNDVHLSLVKVKPAWWMFLVLCRNIHQSRGMDLETLWSSTYHAFDFHIMHRSDFLASLWIASPDARGSFPLPPWPGELHQAFAWFSGGRLYTLKRERHVERIFEYRCWKLGWCSLAWWDPGRPTWLHLRDSRDVSGLYWISSSIDTLGLFGQRWNWEPNRSNASSGTGFGSLWGWLRRGGLKMLEIILRSLN